jgi:hypothetical protein
MEWNFFWPKPIIHLEKPANNGGKPIIIVQLCHNLSFGLVTKASAYKSAGQKGSSGVQKSVREWTLTLPRELSLWKLESRWTPDSS